MTEINKKKFTEALELLERELRRMNMEVEKCKEAAAKWNEKMNALEKNGAVSEATDKGNYYKTIVACFEDFAKDILEALSDFNR